jgi:hypothetical protein
MIRPKQLTLIGAAIVGVLALGAFISIPSMSTAGSIAAAPDRMETVARIQKRLLNDRARLSRGDSAAPSRWFDAAVEPAE